MAAEQTFLATPISGAGGRIIASPFQFVTTGEDNLRITSVNSRAGVRLKLQGRRLDSGGEIKASAWDHVPASDRTATVSDIELGSGALLNLTVFASAGSPLVGQTFVIVQLVRGMDSAAIVLGTLLQGYVTGTQGLGWPGSPIQSSIEGGGVTRSFAGTTPAAGAIVSETVPTGARWELLSLQSTFFASATVVNRFVYLLFTVQALSIGISISQRTMTANQVAAFYFSQGIAPEPAVALGAVVSTVPQQLILPAGSTITVNGLSMQVDDQFGAPTLVVREWLEAA